MRSTRIAAVAALLSLCLLLLGGCGDGNASRPPSAIEPPMGGTLRMVQEAPRSLDPLESDSVYDSLPCNQIFDGLLALDASLNLKPALAETWSVSRDGKTYTFHLRSDVHFHDGTALTAEDVAFTFQRVLHPDRRNMSLAFSYLTVIEGAPAFAEGTSKSLPGVRVLDPRTVEVRLERAYPPFLEVLTMDNVAIVPRATVRSLGEQRFGREPVGTGPFRLATWGDDSLRLEANDDYWAGRPHLDAVEIHFLRDDEFDFGAARFFSGQMDILEPSTDAMERMLRDPEIQLHRYQELSLAFLGLNANEPPLDKARVRQAIAHALNRDAMVAESPSLRREAVGVLPPGLAGYSPEIKTLEHSPDEARRLLAEAGHPNGKGLSPVRLLNPSGGATAERIISRIREDLAAVGLQLEVTLVTWSEMSDALEDGSAPAFLLGWVADLSDPDAFLRSLFESNGIGNYFGLKDARTDRLLELGAVEANPVARARLYRSLERHVLRQAPMVPLYHTLGVVAVHDHVNGLEPGPLGLAKIELERVWLERAETSG
jgi:ABC-type transport system substrate-binding protein